MLVEYSLKMYRRSYAKKRMALLEKGFLSINSLGHPCGWPKLYPYQDNFSPQWTIFGAPSKA